jgi:hypothetical protein
VNRKRRVRIGDLVSMHTHHTGLIGIAVDREPVAISTTPAQIGIRWLGGSGNIDWEPEGWLEVLSEGG